MHDAFSPTHGHRISSWYYVLRHPDRVSVVVERYATVWTVHPSYGLCTIQTILYGYLANLPVIEWPTDRTSSDPCPSGLTVSGSKPLNDNHINVWYFPVGAVLIH